MNMARIGWLQSDVGIQGGAELSCGLLVEHAPEWAEVIYCRPDRRPPDDIDCFVIQNSTTYSARWIEHLSMSKVVRHVRDPWYAGSATLRRYLLDRADLLIFSSPVQVDSFGYEMGAPYAIIPPPVDLAPFKEAARLVGEQETERHGAVAVGRVDIYKGAPKIVDWALRTGTPTTFVGTVMMQFGDLPPFIQFAGPVPYQDMPQVLARFKKLVAMPEWPEAFGRNVVEGWAAGCELVLDGRIGAQWFVENQPTEIGLEGPISEFWNAVKGVL
jgi:hypothetical protein